MRLVILTALLTTMSLASTVDRVVPDFRPDTVLMEVLDDEPTEAPSYAPREESSSGCEDETLDEGEEWHDSDGDEYDCDWYSNENNCEEYGDAYENDGYTAKQACCACAGDHTESPTDTPIDASTLSPTDTSPDAPADAQTEAPHPTPTAAPSEEDTAHPTAAPTEASTEALTDAPTDVPTEAPTGAPTQTPTDEPTEAKCEDYTTSNGTKWQDSGGYNCEWYSETGDSYKAYHCESYGDSYKNDGYTANEACCWCGGGTTHGTTSSDSGSGSTTDALTDTPTSAPIEAQCEDYTTSNGTEWQDSGGYNCEWYSETGDSYKASHCESYGDSYENDGYTANEACCACGGDTTHGTTSSESGSGDNEDYYDFGSGSTTTGSPSGSGAPPTASPTATDEPTEAKCEDYTTSNGTKWQDSGGYNCEWYSETGDSYKASHCESYGDSYEKDGYTANEACCACDGGTTNGTTSSDSGSGDNANDDYYDFGSSSTTT